MGHEGAEIVDLLLQRHLGLEVGLLVRVGMRWSLLSHIES